ncbi:MAG: type II toxin-antitoxin system YafQ family toxin [Bacteroidales bacterium]|nr:type II toxin-antitoxin system YafQ family toxin [Bacteroidales bacterium]
MYTIRVTNQFRKDWKLCQKRGLPMDELQAVITQLATTGTLPVKYRPHKLSGNHLGEWECHIRPDWLLLWEQNDAELTLLMLNTGTHSDIFAK